MTHLVPLGNAARLSQQHTPDDLGLDREPPGDFPEFDQSEPRSDGQRHGRAGDVRYRLLLRARRRHSEGHLQGVCASVAAG